MRERSTRGGEGSVCNKVDSTWSILTMGGELETGSAVHACGCCTKTGQYQFKHC